MGIGEKVVVIDKNSKKRKKSRNGKIIAEYEHYFLVKHRDYKEAYLKSQVLGNIIFMG